MSALTRATVALPTTVGCKPFCPFCSDAGTAPAVRPASAMCGPSPHQCDCGDGTFWKPTAVTVFLTQSQPHALEALSQHQGLAGTQTASHVTPAAGEVRGSWERPWDVRPPQPELPFGCRHVNDRDADHSAHTPGPPGSPASDPPRLACCPQDCPLPAVSVPWI